MKISQGISMGFSFVTNEIVREAPKAGYIRP